MCLLRYLAFRNWTKSFSYSGLKNRFASRCSEKNEIGDLLPAFMVDLMALATAVLNGKPAED